MKVQEFLRQGGTLEELIRDLAIKVVTSEQLPLVILNYCQIDSPRTDPICRECRGLVLEQGTWDVVARAFPRFFNLGEFPDEDRAFDWSNAWAFSKEDGSLMLLYYYAGAWRVNTRGSFAAGPIHPNLDKTWEEVFFGCLDKESLKYFHQDCTYVFELCSQYNKIVRRYETPTLYLLAVVANATTREVAPWVIINNAWFLGVKHPECFRVSSPADVLAMIDQRRESDPTHEGFVVRDGSGRRLKVKSPTYQSLHYFRGNGDNLYNPVKLLPILLGSPGEEHELLTCFPEVTDNYLRLKEATGKARRDLLERWEACKDIAPQKDFALAALGDGSQYNRVLSSVLFHARKNGLSIERAWDEKAEGVLLKIL